MGNVVPVPGFYQEYEDDAATLGRPHAYKLKNKNYVPFAPRPRGSVTPPTVLSLGLKWPPSIEEKQLLDEDPNRFKSATVHSRWTVQQLQEALVAVEEAQIKGNSVDLSEELKMRQREIEEQLHLSMMQLETIYQSYETDSTVEVHDISRKGSFEEAREAEKALANGPGGINGARAPGESGVAWEKRLEKSMRKVVERLAERERRVVQLKVDLKTERSKNTMNEKALRHVKKQLQQVQRRVLEVSPVVAASANSDELRRLQGEVDDLHEELSRVSSERDQATTRLQTSVASTLHTEAHHEHETGSNLPSAGSQAMIPKTWDDLWDEFITTSLPSPIAKILIGQLSTFAVGGTVGSILLLAMALAYKRKGRRSFSEYIWQQLGLVT